MRVVFITNSIGFGGAEKMVAFVSNSLCRRGHEVSIIDFNAFGEKINVIQQTFEDSICVKTYDGRQGGELSRIKKFLFAYRSILKSNVDVIVGFTAFPNYVGRLIGWFKGIPSIMSERGNPYVTINKKNLHSLLELIVINQSDGGVFQMEGAKSFYGRKLQERATIIPNPIFIQKPIREVPFDQREKTVVSVGRLDNYQKRYDIMVKAFSLFVKKNPEWILKMYGDGADVELIRDWVLKEGLVDKVRFMGVSRNPMEDIRKEGMFLITSDFEGISNALLEAMAVGMPCVSTDSAPGGARMLISDGHNGLLAPIGDPLAIAEAMNRFVENPNLAKSCAKNAREVIKRFAADKLIDSWEAYLKEVVNNK